jgi:hypothetical protein
MSVAALLLLKILTGAPQQPLLPAYAHNDYYNAQPLEAALELGFRGVEADYYVIDGELRVGHSVHETAPGRTLESMYLEPLLERFRREGTILPGGETFILNIESKRRGMETYEALHDVLARYEDILTVVRDGVVTPGPVQVILVGWFPSLDYLEQQRMRYAAVQLHYEDLPDDHARYPAHLLKLVSYDYRSHLVTRGAGRIPPTTLKRFVRIAAAAHAVPGRIARVDANDGVRRHPGRGHRPDRHQGHRRRCAPAARID